jgi:hypothetical protein
VQDKVREEGAPAVQTAFQRLDCLEEEARILGAQVFEPATAVVLSYSASPCHEIIAMIDSLSAEKPHG